MSRLKSYFERRFSQIQRRSSQIFSPGHLRPSACNLRLSAFRSVIIFFLFTLTTLAISHPAYSGENPLPLRDAIDYALKNNPEILAAKKNYEAARAKVPQARALEDPMLELENDKITADRDLMGKPMRTYGVSQTVPFPTKLFLRGQAASQEALAVYEAYKEKERQIASRVKATYAQLFLVQKSIAIQKETEALLEQFSQSASARFAVGQATQQDALKAQVEIAKVERELIELEKMQKIASAEFNLLLNRPPESALEATSPGDGRKSPKPIEALNKLALENRPELKGYRHLIERAKKGYSLSKNEYLPDVSLRFKQKQEMGKLQEWSGMMGLSVPLWFLEKQNYNLVQMRSELAMAEAEYKVMENEVLLEVKEAHSKIEAGLKEISLYETSFIAQTEQALKASLTGYEAGKVDFLNLLDSQRMLLDIKLDYYKARMDLEVAFADLEKACGVEEELLYE